jgi:hypothetical protein
MEKGSRSTKSSLILMNAKPSDTANYTCSPLDGIPISAIVHVIQGKCNKMLLKKGLIKYPISLQQCMLLIVLSIQANFRPDCNTVIGQSRQDIQLIAAAG